MHAEECNKEKSNCDCELHSQRSARRRGEASRELSAFDWHIKAPQTRWSLKVVASPRSAESQVIASPRGFIAAPTIVYRGHKLISVRRFVIFFSIINRIREQRQHNRRTHPSSANRFNPLIFHIVFGGENRSAHGCGYYLSNPISSVYRNF